jgi:hypothetical protein
MGDKIFVNFLKYDFEECMKRLKNELDNIPKNSLNALSENLTINDKTNVQVSITEKSSEKDVEEWFRSENLSIDIYNLLKPNGEILKEYFLLKSNAPDYYYRTLEKTTDLRSALVFSSKLNNLFA